MNRAKEVKCMKKSDLVAGKHVVRYQNGGFRFVGKNGDLKVDESKVVSNLMFYNARWEHTGSDDNDLDIVAVYELNEVWKREEPTMTITEDEKAILRNLPAEYKWITRDEDSKLYIYQDKPEKCVDVWMSGRGSMFLFCDQRYSPLYLFNHLFGMVKWEDDEPWRIEDLLKLDVKEDK